MNAIKFFIIGLLSILALTLPSLVEAKKLRQQTGIASWYGPGFHGKKMANGQRFNQWGNTIAHRTLPLGTKVSITSVESGKTVIATVKDRGPYHGNRVADLSKGLAHKLGFVDKGVTKVKIQVLSIPDKPETFHSPRAMRASYAPDQIETLIENIDSEYTRKDFNAKKQYF